MVFDGTTERSSLSAEVRGGTPCCTRAAVVAFPVLAVAVAAAAAAAAVAAAAGSATPQAS